MDSIDADITRQDVVSFFREFVPSFDLKLCPVPETYAKAAAEQGKPTPHTAEVYILGHPTGHIFLLEEVVASQAHLRHHKLNPYAQLADEVPTYLRYERRLKDPQDLESYFSVPDFIKTSGNGLPVMTDHQASRVLAAANTYCQKGAPPGLSLELELTNLPCQFSPPGEGMYNYILKVNGQPVPSNLEDKRSAPLVLSLNRSLATRSREQPFADLDMYLDYAEKFAYKRSYTPPLSLIKMFALGIALITGIFIILCLIYLAAGNH